MICKARPDTCTKANRKRHSGLAGERNGAAGLTRAKVVDRRAPTPTPRKQKVEEGYEQ